MPFMHITCTGWLRRVWRQMLNLLTYLEGTRHALAGRKTGPQSAEGIGQHMPV